VGSVEEDDFFVRKNYHYEDVLDGTHMNLFSFNLLQLYTFVGLKFVDIIDDDCEIVGAFEDDQKILEFEQLSICLGERRSQIFEQSLSVFA
jgi:hypothetical protein